MNSKTWTRIIALTLFAAVATTVQLAAQDNAEQHHHHKYHHYQIVDPGTFGGPQSFLSQSGGLPRAGILNNRGTLTGGADTLTVDPYCFWNPADCYATHGLQWQDDVTTDLGVLPSGIGSQVNWIGANGLTVGVSDNGQPDPLSGAMPQVHGFLWKHGGMTDLGTLPEGGYFSWAQAVNQRGAVVGFAQNTVPDANAMLTGYGYQTRAFYWKNGVMQDLGTLGTGTDALAVLINEREQVIGVSYTSSVPSASCSGAGFPLTTGSFIWDKKNGMNDIGGFGGSCTLAFDLNNHGRVVGQSDLADQTTHPFVWDSATGMTDLDTPDGGFGSAEAINEHGDVVGIGETRAGPQHAILWRKRGGKWKLTDLGTPNGTGCSYAFSINASGQVVGNSGTDNCQGVAFLWEDGGHMVDLNTLVPPNSGLQLFEPQQINDQGEIAVEGTDSNGNQHAVLLVPCDENHPGVEGCDYSLVDATTLQQSATPSTEHPATGTPHGRMPAGMLNRFRSRLGQRTPVSGTAAAPAAEQTPPVNTDGVDVEGEQLLGPLAGRYKGYCGVYGGKLTGYCTAYNYYSCLAKPSTACPNGKTATKPGYFQCSNRFSRYVDLARGCGFN